MASKTLTLVLSFIAGIIAIVILFYPLILLRLPIEALYGMIFSVDEGKNIVRDLASIFIVYFVVFFSLGVLACKLFKSKFQGISPYYTISFALPSVLVLEFMYFFETGGAGALELLFVFLVGLTPMIFYILGIYFFSRRLQAAKNRKY